MNERIYYSREAELRAHRERVIMMLIVAGISVSVGALVTLLFSRDTHEEGRWQRLGEQMDHFVDQGRETANQVTSDLRQNTEKARQDLEKRMRTAGS